LPENLSLFAPEESPLKCELAARLKQLAEAGLFIGTSSWKYEGWLGSIYQSERYTTRGRFSRAQFERDCLREYAEIFHTVSGDFAFYQFPTVSFWKQLFSQVPEGFRFSSKRLRRSRRPKHARYGARVGQGNPLFLDTKAFTAQFLAPLAPYAEAVGVIVFEFPASLATRFESVPNLTDTLGRFFGEVPNTFRYAVEIRRERLLCAEYFPHTPQPRHRSRFQLLDGNAVYRRANVGSGCLHDELHGEQSADEARPQV
jgi:uncharacterized protein YecE (DUF72 family)